MTAWSAAGRGLAAGLLLAAGGGAPAAVIPEGGRDITRDPLAFPELQSDPANGGVAVVETGEPAALRALEIQARVEGNDWDCQAYVRPTEALQAGDAVLAVFEARAVEAPDRRGGSYVKAAFEFPDFWLLTDLEQPVHAPFLKSLMVTAGPEWSTWYLPVRATRDLGADEWWLALRAGMQPQRVQFRNIRLLHYPAGRVDPARLPQSLATYPGREEDAPWRTAAAERIRAHRTAPIRLCVTDDQGAPAPGAKVRVRLVRHAFTFGIAFDAARVLEGFNPRWRETRKLIVDNFTGASFINEFKWQAWAGDWPEPRFQPTNTLRALRWVHEAGLPFRGHTLVWPRKSSVSAEVAAMLAAETPDCAAIEMAIDAHIRDIGEATAFAVSEWDLLNEPVAEREIQDACGDEAMVRWFMQGRKRLPGIRLAINEYGILSSVTDGRKIGDYESLIRWLLDQGAPVDVIGLQGHFKAGEGIPSPDRMLELLDRFAAFELPIRITEFDVAGADPGLVRDVYRDVYTVLFSHPSVIGIQVWEWSEVFDEAGEPTLAGGMHRELVHDTWSTDEELMTDELGQVATRGYLGAYKIDVTLPDGSIREYRIDVGADGVERALGAAPSAGSSP